MQEVISELERLRQRGRTMLMAQRTAVIVAWSLGVIIALVAFDFAFRLPGAVRAVLLAAGMTALLWGTWRYLGPALRFHPSLTQLALRVERAMPAVSGRLASSVEFAAAGIDQRNALADRAVRETSRRLAGESVSAVVNSARTRRDLIILLAAIAVTASLCVLTPTAAATGLTRLFAPFSDARWPARTGVESLMNDVTTPSGVFARGEAMPLRANVTKGEPEQRVDAIYRLRVDGAWQPRQRIVLTHQGGGIHERLVDTNAEAIELSFATEDDQSPSETITLAPPPAVRRASLTVDPPAYAQQHVSRYETELGQGLDDRSVTDVASLAGSQATLRLELNKPLPVPVDHGEQDAWLRGALGWGDEHPLPQLTVDADSPATWTLRWALEGTRTLRMNLRDEHGLGSAEPIQYRIEAIVDAPPSATITQPAADEAVLATAVIALQAEGRDDVALSNLAIEAHVQQSGEEQSQVLEAAAAWSHAEDVSSPEATADAAIELTPLHLKKGDVVLVSAVAADGFEMNGQRHAPVRSAVRRLRVMDQTEFATQLRRQLSAVRQGAIRIEAQQAELQDDVTDDGVQAGMTRAQAQISERIASQRQSVQEIERVLRENRLDDQQLAEILRQTNDLLDFAGRSATKAVEAMEIQESGGRDTARQSGEPAGGSQQSGARQDAAQTPEAARPAGESEPGRDGRDDSGQPRDQAPRPAPDAQETPATPEQPSGLDRPRGEQGREGAPSSAGARQNAQGGETRPSTSSGAPGGEREPTPQEQEIIDSQQEVRDELADLIKLLDRDEDTWVVKQQLESLAQEQAELEQQTRTLGEQTVGQRREELTERQRSEADRIAERQRDLTDQARDLIEQMRDRAEALEQADPQAAESMRNAADTAEQQQLDRDMQQAAQQVQQNQMTSAGASQQNAQRTMQRMMQDIEQTKRAQAQQLLRQLASLVESIQRLITVQEGELTALDVAEDANNFGGLDRSMVRLAQNTQGVAQEARSSGQQARRIARSLDRAADAQGAAVTALRAQPIAVASAREAESRALDLLKEAKELAEALQQQTEQEQMQQKREELIEQYRQFAERQVVIRGETVELGKAGELDRRQLVDARRLSMQQEELRTGLAAMRDSISEILDSPVFSHVHRLIDQWSAMVSEALAGGVANVDVSDRQQMIADAIGRLIGAIEETMSPPPEFAQDQQNQQQDGQGQQGQQPLIPPVAQLKLLQGIQEQVYSLTRDLDARSDLDDAQRRSRLRDLGQQQRELGDLAQQMLESLERQAPPAPPSGPDTPDDAGAPDDSTDQPQASRASPLDLQEACT